MQTLQWNIKGGLSVLFAWKQMGLSRCLGVLKADFSNAVAVQACTLPALTLH